MARDLHDNIKAIRSISPIALGTTGTGQTGKIIDRQGYESVEFVFDYGTSTSTSTTVTPVILEGDVTGTMTSVADANLLGTEANAGITTGTRTSGTNKNVTKRLGYIGIKRYVQAKLINVATAGVIAGAHVLLGNPRHAPLAT
jgi:hypothetical protein